MPPMKRSEAGMSLIELLVALVIASLGLLTLVALQAASLRYTRVTERRAVGSLLADDLLERLRANTTSQAGLSGYVVNESFQSQAAAPPAPATLCNHAVATCTPAQMAAFDLYQWRQSVRRLLPEGAVFTRVTTDPSDPNPTAPTPLWLDVWIAWRDPVLGTTVGVDLRPPDECPAGLQLASQTDDTVRCMRWRVRR